MQKTLCLKFVPFFKLVFDVVHDLWLVRSLGWKYVSEALVEQLLNFFRKRWHDTWILGIACLVLLDYCKLNFCNDDIRKQSTCYYLPVNCYSNVSSKINKQMNEQIRWITHLTVRNTLWKIHCATTHKGTFTRGSLKPCSNQLSVPSSFHSK